MIGNLSDEISLYFHIPFCTRKCDYCHFYVIPDKELAKQQLEEGFQLEWALLQPILAGRRISTIYFGGGTPSLFSPERISLLIRLIQSNCEVNPDAEITLEANPENVSLALMQAYGEAGVNRVSIGVQTLDSHLLKLLGRQHGPETAIKAIHTTYQAGIHNISIDLMYDLPHQTLAHWTNTLQELKLLPLHHLSLYNLTFEPHTVFFKKQVELKQSIPSEEVSLAMLETAIVHLEEIGLHRYEISAFAKPGFASKHNTGYWTGRSFLGLGPSAFSYWEGKRFRNIAHLGRYCRMLKQGQLPRDFEELLTPDAQRRELFVIHLRLCEGVDLENFTLKQGPFDQLMLAALDRLIEENYLVQQNGRVLLTQKGVLFYDSVATELI